MKDSDLGEMGRFAVPRQRPKKVFLTGNVFVGGAIALGLVVLVFVIGLLASHCEHSFRPGSELLQAEHMVSEAAHELVIRGEGGQRGIMFRSVADAMNAKAVGSSGFGTVTVTATATAFKSVGTVGENAPTVTGQSDTAQAPWMPSGQSTAENVQHDAYTSSSDAIPIGVSFPISTHTHLSTIYTIRSIENSTVHLTKTKTATRTVVSPASSEQVSSAADADICSAAVITQTVSVYVTVSPLPDKTVTGDASTATQVKTDLSLTDGLPDVTLPGKASTRTAVQTDVSFTKGLPDATVSGDPETLTDVKTDVSLTAGLPDATVSGGPETVTDIKTSAVATSKALHAVTTIVITDLWDPVRSSQRTLTATVTMKEPAATTHGPSVVTVTISDLYGPGAKPEASSSALAEAATGPVSGTGALTTETVTVTETGGPPATSFTTVHIAPARNTTAATGYPYSTGSAAATAPLQVSNGSKRPLPGTRGGKGGNFVCAVMLIAVMVFAL